MDFNNHRERERDRDTIICVLLLFEFLCLLLCLYVKLLWQPLCYDRFKETYIRLTSMQKYTLISEYWCVYVDIVATWSEKRVSHSSFWCKRRIYGTWRKFTSYHVHPFRFSFHGAVSMFYCTQLVAKLKREIKALPLYTSISRSK